MIKNDTRWCQLAERIILELVSKNERLLKERQNLPEARHIERKELLNEHKELLENNDKLLLE
jgi:hypothetical protein